MGIYPGFRLAENAMEDATSTLATKIVSLVRGSESCSVVYIHSDCYVRVRVPRIYAVCTLAAQCWPKEREKSFSAGRTSTNQKWTSLARQARINAILKSKDENGDV